MIQLPLSSLNFPLSFSPTTRRELQLSTCSDEDDLKWQANDENISLLLKQFYANFHSKTQNDALTHREGLKG